jgi:hypothetical protein
MVLALLDGPFAAAWTERLGDAFGPTTTTFVGGGGPAMHQPTTQPRGLAAYALLLQRARAAKAAATGGDAVVVSVTMLDVCTATAADDDPVSELLDDLGRELVPVSMPPCVRVTVVCSVGEFYERCLATGACRGCVASLPAAASRVPRGLGAWDFGRHHVVRAPPYAQDTPAVLRRVVEEVVHHVQQNDVKQT